MCLACQFCHFIDEIGTFEIKRLLLSCLIFSIRAFFRGTIILMSRHRLTTFRFFGIIGLETVHFVFRDPAIPTVFNVYLMPFDSITWYCLVLCLFIEAIFIYNIMVQEKLMYGMRYDDFSREISLAYNQKYNCIYRRSYILIKFFQNIIFKIQKCNIFWKN